MPRTSLFDRYDTFIAASVLAAHSTTLKKGFRQYDVRGFIEIFTNWIDFGEDYSSLPVQNTQIARYLETLVNEGLARKITSPTARPLYRVTRTGLIELVARVVSKPHYSKYQHFYFVYYFIGNYHPRITYIVKSEGQRFPYSLQLELEALLDSEALLNRQLTYAKNELKKIERRTKQLKRTSQVVTQLAKRGVEFSEILEHSDQLQPFGLTTHRRVSELLFGTEKQALWEMTIGDTQRIKQMWNPARRMLLLHIDELEKLKVA
ncbi:hypothetical protein OAO01_02100 [Oligoflexia bacterium]|nr:hypothetical protein [Oligoflexia bacterium]